MEGNIANLEADLQAVGVQHEAAHTEADHKLKAVTSENSLLKDRYLVAHLCQVIIEIATVDITEPKVGSLAHLYQTAVGC